MPELQWYLVIHFVLVRHIVRLYESLGYCTTKRSGMRGQCWRATGPVYKYVAFHAQTCNPALRRIIVGWVGRDLELIRWVVTWNPKLWVKDFRTRGWNLELKPKWQSMGSREVYFQRVT